MGKIDIRDDGTASFVDAREEESFLEDIRERSEKIARELTVAAHLSAGQILVVGCSSSEVVGGGIGKASIPSVANAILDGIMTALEGKGIYLAAQCCEHLNRALVVERECAERIGADTVCVRPVAKAGGSFAAACYERFSSPVVIEHIRADAGIDIGDTLIGMHLREVAVPVRLSVRSLGLANIVCASTRPKYIGGVRAIYE